MNLHNTKLYNILTSPENLKNILGSCNSSLIIIVKASYLSRLFIYMLHDFSATWTGYWVSLDVFCPLPVTHEDAGQESG